MKYKLAFVNDINNFAHDFLLGRTKLNKRINDIKSIAWQYAEKNSSDGDGTHGILFANKIIELVVQECANIASMCDQIGVDVQILELNNVKTEK